MAWLALRPDAWLLAAAVALDLLLGDPEYPLHPVRLIGRSLTLLENALRALHLDGYAGGILLFVLLNLVWTAGFSLLLSFLPIVAAKTLHLFLLYSLLALRDLLNHGWRVEQAARRNDLPAARAAIAQLVGRDTSRMDLAACRRAAIESLSENLTDGFLSPLCWYAAFGIPGLVLFKIVSTMDSMVGYKTPQYLRFGWCGARTDDAMNWIPARFTWLLLSLLGLLLPNYSGHKALLVGWQQHAIVPGPNAGWSEAAMAGAIERRLVGPIWAGGRLVTEVWLGHPTDPPAGLNTRDLPRAAVLVTTAALVSSLLAIVVVRAAY